MTVSVAEDDDAVPDAGLMLVHKVTGADEYEANPKIRVSDFTGDGDTQGERHAGRDSESDHAHHRSGCERDLQGPAEHGAD